jgi:alkylhydroperoxidase/carboxymuconolactone decarboxylase family protein YurZ
MSQTVLPEWIQKPQMCNSQLAKMYLTQREQVLKDGAIPAKYKILMTMIVDAVMGHSDGCAAIANHARAAGATEDEISEAVEVAYLFGGTPALVTATNAFRK